MMSQKRWSFLARNGVLLLFLLVLVLVRQIPANLQYNGVLIQLVHALPWDDAWWPLDFRAFTREPIIPMAEEVTALCTGSRYLPGCPLHQRVGLLAGANPSVVLSEPRSIESERLLAAFTADISYGLDKPEQAISLWAQHLPPAALLARARAMIAHGDYIVAAALVCIIDGELKNASLHERHEMAVTLAQLATHEAQIANYDGAVRLWEAAIAHIDGRAQYYYGLGNALSHRMRWTEAAAAYNAAIRLEPENPNHYAGLALVQLQQGNEHAALELAEKALTLDPHNLIALHILGRE